MSLKVIGSKAKLHWLSNNHNNGTLTEGQGLLYINPKGLGQVTRNTAAGLTPGRTYEARYAGQKSSLLADFVADDLFIFDKVHGEHYDYDDKCRALINELYRKKRIPFNANVGAIQVENTNDEALIGYDRVQHLDILIDVIKQALGYDRVYDTKDPVIWRWQQAEDAQAILDTLYKHRLCLYAAYTSRGKTKISMEVATQLLQSGGIVLVTTPITDTKQSFKDNINDYHFGSDRSLKTTYMDNLEFAQHTVKSLRARADAGELIFIVLTVQDLRYGDATTQGIRDKYQDLSGAVDLWIRDERHAQYNGEVTSERLADITANYELDLTATPYNVLDQYSWDHIVSRTLLWGLKNRANTNLPEIAITAISTPISAISSAIASMYTADEGFDPRKLFVRENNNFVLAAELEALADRFYHQTVSQRKNPLTITNDTELSDAAKLCGMWVLPAGQDGDSAGDYVPALASMLNTRFADRGTYYVDSYTVERTCPPNTTVGDYIQNLLAQYTRVIILTCGKFLTGTDIPALGHVVLLDKMASIANFEQLMGRMIRLYPGKDRVKLYTLAPGHELSVVMGRMAMANAHLGGGTEWEALDCVPLSEYTIDGPKRISPDEILAETQAWCREQLRTKLPTNSLKIAISNIDTTAWNTVNIKQFKQFAPTTELTDPNDARVKDKLTAATQQLTRQQVTNIEGIADTIQAIMREAQGPAYVENDYNYQTILWNPVLVSMFGDNTIAAVFDAIDQNPDIRVMIRDFLLDRQAAYAGLPYEEVIDQLFINNSLKCDIGLVYTPMTLARELVNAIEG